MAETTTIEVQRETWKQLNIRKDAGETFDEVIQDLMPATVREFDGEEPQVVDWERLNDAEKWCANHIPDRGECGDKADYLLTVEYNGKEQKVPYCDQHANISEGADA
jgi:hypothetical protein